MLRCRCCRLTGEARLDCPICKGDGVVPAGRCEYCGLPNSMHNISKVRENCELQQIIQLTGESSKSDRSDDSEE